MSVSPSVFQSHWKGLNESILRNHDPKLETVVLLRHLAIREGKVRGVVDNILEVFTRKTKETGHRG